MSKLNRFTLVSLTLFGAFLLNACGGTLPQFSSPEVGLKVQAKEIVFTGIVEAINGNEWIVSGQKITVDPAAATDPNITVGVIVKVEGQVAADGVVTALKVETFAVSDDNVNVGNTNDNGNLNTNGDNSNTANDNGNPAGGAESEVFGVVETLATDSITVNGVTYQLASFTEIKDAIIVGDQVKIHFLVNSDGTFTIREIEKSDRLGDDNSNGGNSNEGNASNSNDGNNNDDNGNDDNSNDDNSGNGSGDDDENDSNDNDDNDND